MPSTIPAPRVAVLSPTAFPFGLPADRQRRAVDGWLDMAITGRVDVPLIVTVDLDQFPYEPEVGVLVQLMRRVGRELGERNQGRLVIVFATSREPVREAVRALAASNDIPIYLAEDAGSIDRAQPAINLTPGKRLTLDAVAASGRATATSVADATGSTAVAAGNALSELHSQGLLLRYEGSGRVAHTYAHPAAAAQGGRLQVGVAIPQSLSVEIAEIANMAGRDPEELIAQAWRDFMSRNASELADRYHVIAGQIRSGDRAGLLESLTQDDSGG